MAHPELQQTSTLKDIQLYVKAIVRQRGFDNETVQDSFILLVEEAGELAEAIRRHSGENW